MPSYNQAFTQAVRQTLAQRSDVEEKFMFQAMCFMVDGKLCMGVGEDELMVRINPADHDHALEHTGTREMKNGERVMRGYIFVDLHSLQTKAQFDYWVHLALAFNPLAKASRKRSKPKDPIGAALKHQLTQEMKADSK